MTHLRTQSTPLRTALIAGGLAAGALALANCAFARRTERRHPPEGRFIDVDGVRLHYTDRGQGSPIVLIHGNIVTGADFDTSGLSDRLLQGHRVIIFDRPGFGHSERPRAQIWTAERQADLLHQAIAQLGIELPVVVGHSWGAMVAMAMAVRHEAAIAGVVVLGGYYFWTLRPDVLPAGLGALPVVGDLLRFTVSPVLNWLMMPLVKRAMFAPGPVTRRFNAEFSTAMAVRPSQIRATAEDGALMIPGALAMRDHYSALKLPVVIMAGEGDRVVFKRQAEALRAAIPGSVLFIVQGAGHMVHHQATEQAAEAVEAAVALAAQTTGAEASQRPYATAA